MWVWGAHCPNLLVASYSPLPFSTRHVTILLPGPVRCCRLISRFLVQLKKKISAADRHDFKRLTDFLLNMAYLLYRRFACINSTMSFSFHFTKSMQAILKIRRCRYYYSGIYCLSATSVRRYGLFYVAEISGVGKHCYEGSAGSVVQSSERLPSL
jgi:hypothetical protein